jgi:hypothetical protein
MEHAQRIASAISRGGQTTASGTDGRAGTTLGLRKSEGSFILGIPLAISIVIARIFVKAAAGLQLGLARGAKKAPRHTITRFLGLRIFTSGCGR